MGGDRGEDHWKTVKSSVKEWNPHQETMKNIANSMAVGKADDDELHPTTERRKTHAKISQELEAVWADFAVESSPSNSQSVRNNVENASCCHDSPSLAKSIE